jgi:hypothetical protein
LKLTSEQYELIDHYLKGTLSDTEKLALEKRMKEDAAFSEEVSFQKMLREIIFEKGLVDIRQKVGEDISPSSGTTYKKPILISLTALILTGGVLFFYLQKNKDDKVSPESTPSMIQEQGEGKGKPQGEPAIQSHPYIQNKKIGAGLQNNPKKLDETGSPDQALITKHSELPAMENLKEHPISDHSPASEHLPAEPSKLKDPEKESMGLMEKQREGAPCSTILFNVKLDASCAYKPTGAMAIIISSIEGGKEPYTYSLDGKDFGAEAVFTQLSGGHHPAFIRDDRGCVTQKEIVIPKEPCPELKDYSFNPETESWKFPLNEHESGSITIADKNGKVVYTAKIENGNPGEWNGRSAIGETLQTGSYLYIAKPDRGEIRQGFILILH